MAYKKVVVPLDGTKLAELALPHLEEIASGCHISKIELVTVTEQKKGQLVKSDMTDELGIMPAGPLSLAGEDPSIGPTNQYDLVQTKRVTITMGKMAKSARGYLLKIAQQLEKKGLTAHTTVLIGNVADEIVRFADEERADLIIMASQGKTAIRTWDVGKAAIKVFRNSNVPVLLVKPPADFKESSSSRKGKAL